MPRFGPVEWLIFIIVLQAGACINLFGHVLTLEQ